MVEHSSIVNLSFWHQRQYNLSSLSRAILYSGVAFDALVWEIYPYLLIGARLYPIRKKEIRLDVKSLVLFLQDYGITHTYLPTTICKELIESGCKVDTMILTGGEALSYSTNPYLKVYNNYGPTENTVVSTFYGCDKIAGHSIPIGKPIDNVIAFILNTNDELQPIGVIGELCIGGSGLARGYLNRPNLTEEKFVSNPFREGDRIYKTGDLARWLPDGNIEFIGRKDDQVKIRGYRIELESPRESLINHPLRDL